MDQKFLNKVRVDEWYDNDVYELLFKLKLTAKHELAVGKWEVNGCKGVDLRRWSLSEARLLGEGITINENTWKNVCDVIYEMQDKNYFNDSSNKSVYDKKIPVDEDCYIFTTLFESQIKPYFCLNVYTKNGQPVWKNRFARCGIMIRFDTIKDFFTNCRHYKIFDVGNVANETKLTDKKTGKQIF